MSALNTISGSELVSRIIAREWQAHRAVWLGSFGFIALATVVISLFSDKPFAEILPHNALLGGLFALGLCLRALGLVRRSAHECAARIEDEERRKALDNEIARAVRIRGTVIAAAAVALVASLTLSV